jgi:hypothetical protein
VLNEQLREQWRARERAVPIYPVMTFAPDDTVAVLPDLVKQDEPRLCPAYAPDVAGSDQGKAYEENRPRQYEDFKEPCPELGHSVFAVAGPRGPRRISLTASTTRQSLHLQFGEWNIASDLSIVTYPLFKAALLAISAAWDVQWACAQAFRLGAARVPIDFAPGVPAFRIDSVVQVPLDPTFPKSIFHAPWIVYL